jgi:hypothetical protein
MVQFSFLEGFMSTALVDVDSTKYKPSRSELARNKHNLELIQLSERHQRLDERANQPKERVIRVVYQGGWYRAFYEGSDQSTFGATPAEARSRLKYFDGASSSHKKVLRDKYEGAN